MKPFDYFIDKKNNLNTNILSNIIDLNSGIKVKEIPVLVDRDNQKTLLNEKDFQELYDKNGSLWGFLSVPGEEIQGNGVIKFSDIKEQAQEVEGKMTVQNSYVTMYNATPPFANAIEFNIDNNNVSDPTITFSYEGFYIYKVYGFFGKLSLNDV